VFTYVHNADRTAIRCKQKATSIGLQVIMGDQWH